MLKVFRRMGIYLACCRPQQWAKNLLCCAAFVIAPVPFKENWIYILLTTLSFILSSSFIYIINDLIDIKLDQNHPVKKFRPIAYGKVKINEVLLLALILFALSISIPLMFNIKILAMIVTYIFLNIFYCFWGKNKSIIDIYLIASGFIIRAYSGALAIKTSPSHWFLITAGCLALFLAIQKRKSEYIRISLNNSAKINSRKVLNKYNEKFLEKFEIMALTSGFLSYTLWASGPQLGGANTNNMLITCPILLMGILRYQLISERNNDGVLIGESPTKILFKDKGIQTILIIIIVSSWFIIRA